MKNLIDYIDYENIMIGNDEIDVDIENIKNMTMAKLRNDNKKDKKSKGFSLKKPFVLVACFVILFCGITVCAVANTDIRNYFSEIFGFNSQEVLLFGESVESDDYSFTVENVLYDGINCNVIFSVSGVSELGKQNVANFESRENFEIQELLHCILPDLRKYTISTGTEFDENSSEGELIFNLSFANPVNNEHLYTNLNNRIVDASARYYPSTKDEIKRIEELSINFDGEDIKISLQETTPTAKKEINIPPSDDYPVKYTSIIYSSIGFTLIGEIGDLDTYYENNKIEINYSDNSTVLLNSYYSDNREEHVYETGYNFLGESYMYYDDGDKIILESNFVFNTAVDWDEVEALIINETRIELD